MDLAHSADSRARRCAVSSATVHQTASDILRCRGIGTFWTAQVLSQCVEPTGQPASYEGSLSAMRPDASDFGPSRGLVLTRTVAVVTAASVAIRKSVFGEAGPSTTASAIVTPMWQPAAWTRPTITCSKVEAKAGTPHARVPGTLPTRGVPRDNPLLRFLQYGSA